MLSKVLAFLNGKKTFIGAIISIMAFTPAIAALLPSLGVGNELTLKITGICVLVIGLAHKAYKYVFGEEHV